MMVREYPGLLLDPEDLEKYGNYAVVIHHGYAQIQYKGKVRTLHSLICDVPEGLMVDHRDTNRLNCKRDNLRPATRSQNMQNTTGRSKSGYKGVYKRKNGSYQAQILANGLQITLGSFATDVAAAQAYNEAAIKYFGEFANLNEIPNG